MASFDFNKKRIADPVYGTIGLSEAELRVVSTKPFQRLRNVKHLGLVDYVFPGATYARFSHCLGACHLTGRILESLKLSNTQIDGEKIQRYRMAALLHDIGHYPFSHVMEGPVKDHYQAQMIQPKNYKTVAGQAEEIPRFFNHESLGKEIVISGGNCKIEKG